MAGFRRLFPLLSLAILGQASLTFATAPACGETSYSSSGVFQSPNYPNNYLNNLHCVYRLYPSSNITLGIDYLRLEENYDFLSIVYTDVNGDQQNVSFTGNSLESMTVHADVNGREQNISSTDTSLDTMVGRNFEITFTSDGSNTDQGFRLPWGMYACGETSHNTTGVFQSPNYPNNYYNNFHCVYRINPSSNIELSIDELQLEYNYDFLRIVYTDLKGDQRKVSFTGSSLDTMVGKNFEITFTSDESSTNQGFSVSWKKYACHEMSYNTSGVLRSPNYPSGYPNNFDCVYQIYPSYNIKLSIDDLQLEENNDFLRIVYTDLNGEEQNVSSTNSSLDTMVGSYFKITFTSDGSNTDRGFSLSWKEFDPGSDLSTQAPDGSIMVTCDSRDFKVTVPRDLIQQLFPGSSPNDLTLGDPNCRGQIYNDVVMFRSSIFGCDMTREETADDIVYKNRITTQVSGHGTKTTNGSLITRFNSKAIYVECHLNRDLSVIGHFMPQNHELVALGAGNFSVHMDLYRDQGMNHKITSYPMYIGLNQDVYVDVGLESDDPELKISLQNCVAKPTVDPYDHINQYYLIRDGCPADQTVAFQYTSSLKDVHFRFRTFEFVRNDRDVYIFCYVRVCSGTDDDNRCRRDCSSMHRRVREASDDRADHDLHIFQGPLTFREKRNAAFQVAERNNGKDSNNAAAVPAIVIAIAAVTMVMAAVVMVIRGKRLNNSHTKGVDTEM